MSALREGKLAGIRRTVRNILLGRPHGLRAGVRRWVGASCGWRSEAREPEQPLAPATVGPQSSPGAGRAGPEGYEDVLGAEELKPGQLVEVIAGGRTVALGNVDGRFVAVSGACPHAGGPLADGYLDGTTLTCPLHGWTFDVDTGACHVDPAETLQTWDVRVVGGRVWVHVAV